MAGSSLLALLDDIATLLDDVAAMTKVAAKNTAGVLGDDLALNAEQVSGVRAEREIPVVLAVAKGSLKNKVILVPAALLISAFVPWLIVPLLMLGGAYLCFEGAEKLLHHFLHNDDEEAKKEERNQAFADPSVDVVAFEKEKIKGAIRTDFVLSAEIIVIALGTVKDEVFLTQATVVSLVALLITIGVYSVVAGIVKLDDLGFYLLKSKDKGAKGLLKRRLGVGLLGFAPILMKTLSVVGTAAMFLVGGGILLHGIPASHHWLEAAAQLVQPTPLLGGLLGWLSAPVLNGLFGLLAGALLVVGFMFGAKLIGRKG